MSHIFISYSRRDIDFASKVVQALADNNLDTWVDWKSIPKGEDWEQEIYHGIEEADAFLFLISPDSVASQMCNKEIAHAVKNGKRILPVFISNEDPGEVHKRFYTDKAREEISKRNYIFCRERQDDFNKAIEETCQSIHTDYEWLKYHTELQVKALRWEQKKDNSRLLRGKELREAEQQLAEVGAQEDPQPTKIQREYILASQRYEVHQRRQFTIGLVTGLAILAIFAVFAWAQRNTAKVEANSRATAESNTVSEANAKATAQANAETQGDIAQHQLMSAQIKNNFLRSQNALSEGNVDIAVLLSLDAYKLAKNNNVETRLTDLQALHDALELLQGGIGLGFEPNLRDKSALTNQVAQHLFFLPDGQHLVAVGFDAKETDEVEKIVVYDLSNPDSYPCLFYGESDHYQSQKAYDQIIIAEEQGLAFFYKERRLYSLTLDSFISCDFRFEDIYKFENYASTFTVLDNKLWFFGDGFIGNFDLKNLAEPPEIIYFQGYEDLADRDTKTAVSSDYKWYVLGNRDNTVYLWSLEYPETPILLRDDRALDLSDANFSYNNQEVFAYHQNTKYTWPLSNLGQVSVEEVDRGLTENHSPVHDVRAVRIENGLLTFIMDANKAVFTFKLYDLFGYLDENNIKHVAFSPNGDALFIVEQLEFSSRIHVVLIQNIEGRYLFESYSLGGFAGKLDNLVFGPNDQLAIQTSKSDIRVWNYKKDISPSYMKSIPSSNSYRLLFGEDNNSLFLSNYSGTSANSYSLSWATIANPEKALLSFQGDSILSIENHREEKMLVGGTSQGDLLVSTFYDLFYNPDVYTGFDEAKTMRLSSDAGIYAIAISPDAGKFAATDTSYIAVWDAGQIDHPSYIIDSWKAWENDGFQGDIINLAFTPDGKYLLSVNEFASISIWNTNDLSGFPQTYIIHDHWVTDIEFSPTQNIVATTSWDGRVKLWNSLNFQEPISVLEGHTDHVTDIEFSPSGNLLASIGNDGKVQVWDINNLQAGPLVIRFLPSVVANDWANSLAFSPDGKWLAYSGDGQLFMRLIDPESLSDAACSLTGRNFTQAEWQQYFPSEPYRLTCSQYPAGE